MASNLRSSVARWLYLRSRVNHAAQSVRVQPLLFDGIERISEHFMPPHGRRYQAISSGNPSSIHHRISHPNYTLFL